MPTSRPRIGTSRSAVAAGCMRRSRRRRLDHRAVRLRLRPQAPPPADGVQGSPRRQGRQPRRDDQRAGAAGAARASRSPPTPAGPTCTAAGPTGSTTRSPSTSPELETQDGPQARRPRRPAARQRALGRQVLDAGDDGHRPQPRPQRQEREGPRRRHRRRALRLRLLPPVHRDVRPHRARRRRRALRAPARGGQGDGRRQQRRRPLGRRAQGAVRAVQGRRQGGRPASRSRRTR